MSVNARLDIKVGLQIRRRLDAERFRPSTTRVSAWHEETDLDGYESVLTTLCTSVFSEATTVRGDNDDLEVHASVRMDNPTHPTAANGVVPLAKSHYDFHLANGDFTSASTLESLLNDCIVLMKQQAKY